MCVCVCVCACMCMDTRATVICYCITGLCLVVMSSWRQLCLVLLLCFEYEMIKTLAYSLLWDYFIHSLTLGFFPLCLLQRGWAPSPWGWSSSALPSLASSPMSLAAELQLWVALLLALLAYWPAPLSRKAKNPSFSDRNDIVSPVLIHDTDSYKVIGVVRNLSPWLIKNSVGQEMNAYVLLRMITVGMKSLIFKKCPWILEFHSIQYLLLLVDWQHALNLAWTPQVSVQSSYQRPVFSSCSRSWSRDLSRQKKLPLCLILCLNKDTTAALWQLGKLHSTDWMLNILMI